MDSPKGEKNTQMQWEQDCVFDCLHCNCTFLHVFRWKYSLLIIIYLFIYIFLHASLWAQSVVAGLWPSQTKICVGDRLTYPGLSLLLQLLQAKCRQQSLKHLPVTQGGTVMGTLDYSTVTITIQVLTNWNPNVIVLIHCPRLIRITFEWRRIHRNEQTLFRHSI